MMKFAGEHICPGFWVDQAWHAHLLYTSHYSDVCNVLFCEMVGHNPSKFSKSDIEKEKLKYQSTLKIYSSMFESSIPIEIWKEPDYENPINNYMPINLWDYIRIKSKS